MTEKYIHINIQISLNEDSWSYSDPHVSERIDFTIPEYMFDCKRLADHITQKIDGMKKEFPNAVIEYEKEKEKARINAEATA